MTTWLACHTPDGSTYARWRHGVPQSILFRVTRNAPPGGTELLDSLEQELRAILPSSWTLDSDRCGEGKGIDAIFQLMGPDRSRARVLVEVKRAVEPRDVAVTLNQIHAYQRRESGDAGQEQLALVVAPYLSPLTRERLAEAGAGWFDATGNVRVQLEQPSLFIDRTGATRNPYTDPDDRRLRSLRGAAAARVVRALLDGRGRRGVRALAAEAGVGPATSARAVELLARDAVIERDPAGAVISVRKQSLVRRWAQDYGLTTTNDAVPVLAPRGIDRLLDRLTQYQGPYTLTGSAAAMAYRPAEQAAVAPLMLAVIFVPDAVAARRNLELRQTERGANVLLVEPFDDLVYRGATMRDGLQYVSPSQAVVDLLTGPGRSAEEGSQLIDVLGEQDQEWTR